MLTTHKQMLIINEYLKSSCDGNKTIHNFVDWGTKAKLLFLDLLKKLQVLLHQFFVLKFGLQDYFGFYRSSHKIIE